MLVLEEGKEQTATDYKQQQANRRSEHLSQVQNSEEEFDHRVIEAAKLAQKDINDKIKKDS